MSIPVAIFGFTDTLAAQLLSFLEASGKYDVRYFLSAFRDFDSEPLMQRSDSASLRIEYPENGRVFGLPLIVKDVYDRLVSDRIKNVFVIEDSGRDRARIFEQLKKYEISVESFIHKSVVLGANCSIGQGSVVFPNCYIGYKARLGICTVLQSGVSIDHHTWVGNFCDLNPRVSVAGLSTIGDFVEVNLAVDIVNRVTLGNNSRIGAGSLVLKDCSPNALYYGRPARQIRPQP